MKGFVNILGKVAVIFCLVSAGIVLANDHYIVALMNLGLGMLNLEIIILRIKQENSR